MTFVFICEHWLQASVLAMASITTLDKFNLSFDDGMASSRYFRIILPIEISGCSRSCDSLISATMFSSFFQTICIFLLSLFIL